MMKNKNYIPSRTSPKGGRRGCLCWETNTYSVKCCDGSVRAQGIGSVYLTETTPAFSGILDTYSGAAAAYSLRQLSSTYTGNAIKVRRSSDNTTKDIGFVSNVLDTATLETFCSGTDGFVTTWYDQSGNANNATQATASRQPKIVSSGSTILENGKAAVQFDGSVNTPNLLVSAFSSSISTTTASIVFNAPSGDFIFDDNDTVNKNSLYLISGNTIRLYGGEGSPNNFTHSISPDTWGDRHLVSFVSDVANSKLGIDGSFTSSALGAATTMSGVTLGSAATGLIPMVGTMQEAIIYGSNKSSDLSGIETNINTHYSIY